MLFITPERAEKFDAADSVSDRLRDQDGAHRLPIAKVLGKPVHCGSAKAISWSLTFGARMELPPTAKVTYSRPL